jgi:hypothetical protein
VREGPRDRLQPVREFAPGSDGWDDTRMARIIRWGDPEMVWGNFFWGQLVPETPGWKDKKSMGSDIIPHARDAYGEYLLRLRGAMTTQGPALGLDPAITSGFQATLDAQKNRMTNTDTAAAALASADGLEKDGRKMTDQVIRESIAAWKLLPAWNTAIAAALEAVSSKPPVDMIGHKVKFTVRLVAGEIRIDWVKAGVYGVHVYSRLKGQTKWIRIALDTSSPYIDGRELAVAGVAETREYMLRACDRDEADFGVDSDIGTITWSGQ